jgi:preprotein translocase subunit Sss1
VASLQEKLENLWRDIKWVVSTASKPDDDEFKLTARFLVLLAFIAGAFQIVFHIAGVYLKSAVARSTIPTLGDPVKETVAALTSIGVILAALLYLMAKLR